MTLTLNQFLFLVLTIAAVVVVVFLVMLLVQLRRTALEAQKALSEFREAAKNLQILQESVQQRLDDVGRIIDASKKAAQTVSQAAQFVGGGGFKPAAKLWPVLVPLVGFLWRRWKSRKEEKDVGK
jgi:Sec-independent protein translocase protein TatA